MLQLQVITSPLAGFAFTNCIFVNSRNYGELCPDMQATPKFKPYIELLGTVYMLKKHDDVPLGKIACSNFQRNFLNVELDQMVTVKRFVLPSDETLYLENVEFNVTLPGRTSMAVEIDCRELSEALINDFEGQVLVNNMTLVHKFQKRTNLLLTVAHVQHYPKVSSSNQEESSVGRENPIILGLKSGAGGVLMKKTTMRFAKVGDSPLRLTGQVTRKSASKMIDTNFEKLGIGGLNKEFGDIFRRAFVSRILPPDVVKKLGIKHVRGMMLYGPPGCGKTLIARQISKVLQGGETAREPKIVSGPEILSKYVGDSEKNVRELFAEAEEEQNAAGDDSELHVIIFDEIDAICRQRGTKRDGTGVGDSVVNQLLAKIDGVNSLNNVLLIGMTNRLDMIDNALLRPGRFEVQIEIGLPDEVGRGQIIKIHTKSMSEANLLGADVDIPYLARETKNFSGAEIEGLVKSAVSFATNRHVNTDDLSKLLDAEAIIVTGEDFENALGEVHPAFGLQGEDELKSLYRNGVFPYSDSFAHLQTTLNALATQTQTSARTPLLSVLVSGPKGSGKTAMVAKMATEAGFAFTKFITAETMIGMGENQKCSEIASIFEDAYKSPLSLIVLDDIERLIEYVPIGPRFANLVLQALLVLINKPPPKEDRKLMVIGTTAVPHLLQDLGLVQVFNVELSLPLIQSSDEVSKVIQHIIQEEEENNSDNNQPLKVDAQELSLIAENCTKPIPVKKLLVVIEMARQGENSLTFNRFMECLSSIGSS